MAKKHKSPYARKDPTSTSQEDQGRIISDETIETFAQDPRVQLLQADFEKQAALDNAGQEEQVYGFWGQVYKFYNWYYAKTHGFRFKKKTYLWLLFTLGWAGGHRWYQGRRILGAISTLICWTGIPLCLCVIDFMEVVPIKADEEGYIVM